MAQRSNNWLWFFAVIAVLGVLAVAINWTYNARQQLTPEKLTAAVKSWEDRGPDDYDLMVEKKFSSAAGAAVESEFIAVTVRGGKVIAGTLNGQPLEERLYKYYSMPDWFEFVETLLTKDLAPGAPRTYRVASFDPATGQLQRFVRRVSGTNERQEIVFQLSKPMP